MPIFFSRRGNLQCPACAASPAGRLIELLLTPAGRLIVFLTAQRDNQLVRQRRRIATPSMICQRLRRGEG